MYTKSILPIAVLILLFDQTITGQQMNYFFIPSEHLSITCNKTTNLIFPSSIQSIDRGSKDILVQQPKGTENIIQVKGNDSNFKQTTLSVITVNGKLYSFIVDYAVQPVQLNFVIQNEDKQLSDSIFKQTVLFTSVNNDELFHAVALKILNLRPRCERRYRKYQMEFKLNGIYVNHDIFYFRFRLKNSSNVSYNVDNVKFIIRDWQKARRTAIQEIEILPVYKFGGLANAQPDSLVTGVIALPKFTLPDSKYLFIQAQEKNGERSLHLHINHRQLMKAVSVKEY